MKTTTECNADFKTKALEEHRQRKSGTQTIATAELIELITGITREIVNELLAEALAAEQKSDLLALQAKVAVLQSKLAAP